MLAFVAVVLLFSGCNYTNWLGGYNPIPLCAFVAGDASVQRKQAPKSSVEYRRLRTGAFWELHTVSVWR